MIQRLPILSAKIQNLRRKWSRIHKDRIFRSCFDVEDPFSLLQQTPPPPHLHLRPCLERSPRPALPSRSPCETPADNVNGRSVQLGLITEEPPQNSRAGVEPRLGAGTTSPPRAAPALQQRGNPLCVLPGSPGPQQRRRWWMVEEDPGAALRRTGANKRLLDLQLHPRPD